MKRKYLEEQPFMQARIITAEAFEKKRKASGYKLSLLLTRVQYNERFTRNLNVRISQADLVGVDLGRDIQIIKDRFG